MQWIDASGADQLLAQAGQRPRYHCQHAHEVAEVVGQRKELKTGGVGGERNGMRAGSIFIAPLPSLIQCSAVPRWL